MLGLRGLSCSKLGLYKLCNLKCLTIVLVSCLVMFSTRWCFLKELHHLTNIYLCAIWSSQNFSWSIWKDREHFSSVLFFKSSIKWCCKTSQVNATSVSYEISWRWSNTSLWIRCLYIPLSSGAHITGVKSFYKSLRAWLCFCLVCELKIALWVFWEGAMGEMEIMSVKSARKTN